MTIAGLGIDELNGFGISLYPNPSNGEFYITTVTSNVNLKVYSIDGKVIINNLKITQAHQQINLGNVEKGIYFVEVSNDTNKEIMRLVVE